MKKIRIGNDFVFAWEIERNGLPEDLSSVLEKHLHLSVFGKRVELVEGVDYDINGNVIRIEVTPAIANIIGTYKAEFHYILPDNGLIDEDRKCAVDVDAFQIVARTAQADDPSEFTVTSDMAIAFKGDKGDSAYQVWLDAGNTGTEEDYFAYLRQPAVDAGASISELESEIQSNEDLRVQAENERDSAETSRIQAESERLAAEIIRQSNEDNRIENEATRVQNEAERISEEGIRQSNETDRIEAEGIRQSNEINRIEAEGIRVQAEVERQNTIQEAITATNLANEKANLANTAAQSANEAADSALTATQEATTAASLADTARLAIQDDLELKANHGYTSNPKTLKQVDDSLVQLAGDVEQLAYVKIKNEAVNGNFENGSPSPFYKVDGGGGASTLAINSSTPISGNYDIRLTIITPSTRVNRPYINGVHGSANIGDKIYLHFYAKILSGEPIIYGIDNGAIQSTTYGGNIINGRNTRIIDVEGTNASGLIHFDSSTTWDMQMDNFMRINLTETFVAGNEPTEEEMNLLISTLGIDYFEGEITIPAQKIMQWQLALIRKNKNAIIALGGTII